MAKYIDCLRLLHSLLEQFGEEHWRHWLEQDLEEWESHQSTKHHLSAYGTAGSFSEFGLDHRRGHSVSAEDEPWVNYLIEDLRGLCWKAAQDPPRELGPGDSLLSERGTDSLSGAYCQCCGYRETSPGHITLLVAMQMVQEIVHQALADDTLGRCLAQVLNRDRSQVEREVQAYHAALREAALALRPEDGWMTVCTRCGSTKVWSGDWEIIRDGDRLVLRPEQELPPDQPDRRPGCLGLLLRHLSGER